MIWIWGDHQYRSAGAAALFTPAALSRLGRAGTGTLLIALSATHPVVIGHADGMALIVDSALGLIGLGLLATLVSRASIFRQSLSVA